MSRSAFSARDFLDSVSLFRSLDGDSLQLFADNSTVFQARRRAVLTTRGQRHEAFFVLAQGHVKLSVTTPRGQEKIVKLLSRGDTFGEAAMFLQQPYLVTAESLSSSTLVRIPRNVVAHALRQPRFARAMIDLLSSRVRDLVLELEGYTARTGRERVAAYLLRELANGAALDARRVRLPAAKHVIAAYLKLTHEHFSRILRELADGGAIEVEGRVIRVRDPAKLQAEAT